LTKPAQSANVFRYIIPFCVDFIMRSFASLPPPLPKQAPPARPQGLRLLSIDECPAHIDTTLGDVLRDMRLVRGMSERDLAQAVGTTLTVISRLEAGRVRALPPWTELERIVAGYGRVLAFDVSPALRRLRAQTIAGDPTVESHELPPPSMARAPLAYRRPTQIASRPHQDPGPAGLVPAARLDAGPAGRPVATPVPANGRGRRLAERKAPRGRRSSRALMVPLALLMGLLGISQLPEGAAVLDLLQERVVHSIRSVAARVPGVEESPSPPSDRLE
jgi:transcriptional regulator with XRE-family HTH domain